MFTIAALLQEPSQNQTAPATAGVFDDPVGWLQTNGLDMGIALLQALAIFVIGRWVAKILISVLNKVMVKRQLDATLIGFITSLCYMALLAMVSIAAIGKLGVDTTSFAAIIAAAGLAIGFALQGSLGNFAAGVMLILFRPFKKGDFIEAAGVMGVVEDIAVFATTMKTGDNKKVIVPNSNLTGGNITNYSANDTRRVDMTFGIGYQDDIKKAKDVLRAIVEADDRVLKEPAVTIAVSELADSSVNFVCRPWVSTADYWGVYFDVHERVKLEFDKHGISIPYPQQDVHMHEAAVGAL